MEVIFELRHRWQVQRLTKKQVQWGEISNSRCSTPVFIKTEKRPLGESQKLLGEAGAFGFNPIMWVSGGGAL